MSTLIQLIWEATARTGEPLFAELPKEWQRRLVEAYILSDDSEIPEVLVTLPPMYHSLVFGQFAGACDDSEIVGETLHDFRDMFRNAAVSYYDAHIQTIMDRECPRAIENERASQRELEAEAERTDDYFHYMGSRV